VKENPMTYEEAKQKAIAAFVAQGLSPEEAAATVTPADIKNFGWSYTDPTANCDTTVVLSQQQLNDHAAAAMAEAQGNQIITNAISFLLGAAKKVVGAGCLVAVLLLMGGCASTAGKQLASDAQVSLTTYVGQRDDFDAKLIDDKLAKNIATADELHQAAVESHTTVMTVKVPTQVIVKTVAADGTSKEEVKTEMRDAQIPQIDPRVMSALQQEKGRKYAESAGIAAGEYARIAKMNINAANAARSISDLSAYLGEQAKVQMSASQGLEAANSLLDTFLQSKKKASAP
jgi:hypothetical protein